MLLLAVETSTARSSVALATEDGVQAASELGRDRRHGEFVAPAIAELLHHLGAEVGDLTAVAAGTGPGLYTGLRVGLVTAATIAGTRALPCVGITGPDALAHRVRHTDRSIAVALDARRKEVYLATYEPGADGATVAREVAVGTPAEAAEALAVDGGRVLLVGDGAGPVVDALAGREDAPDVALGGPDTAQPTAADLALLGVAAVRAGAVGGVEVLRPLYLRDADARIGWDQRGRLRGGGGS